MARIVKTAFTHTYGHGGSVVVPQGARTERAHTPDADYAWVDPSIYPEGSTERHDADFYGIRVPLTNIEET